ncbi:MAG: DNA polymerase III subunit alpha [Corynebacteriales bacterium]|nr:DNA polymerase III subunit alpha [Mycobacteriales bacterium]
MLDGAARLKDLFAETDRMGMPAVAMTDHGNLYGAYDFHGKATKAGVTPIIGIEAYVAPESRFHKQPVKWGDPSQKRDDISGAGAYTHKTLLARTPEGLRNLFRLSSRASLEGYLRKPRMDRELIAEHAAGITATTGCPSGEVQTRLRLGQPDKALEAAAAYRDIFGPENYFVELMDHGLEIEQRVRDGLREIRNKLNLRYVVTNDLHYTHEADATSHEALLCVQTGSNLSDPNRFKFDGSGYYLKSPADMRGIYTDEEWQEGCDSTLLIAERVESYAEVFAKRDLMPRVDVPEGETEETYLRKEVHRGLEKRFPQGVPPEHTKQADYEIDVVCQMGFPGYFLVTADLVRHAHEVGIRVGPGRGSAAGAVIAWALGITELDPMAHGLLFERFLNPDRISMPDIDMDFDERRRGDMIRYATEKYGEERVAQIITYGTIKAKAAVKDSARVLGYPYAVGDRITKAMPPAVMGKDIPLSGIFDSSHPRYKEAVEFRQIYEEDADARKVVDTARGLEGLIRQSGVHAAGVILSAEPLLDVIPVHKREQDGAIITQFDMGACESMGLLKMDFLGLRNLTVLDDCLLNIKANRDEDVVLEELPLDNKAAYELLARGDTLGVFQLDGGPMRSLLRSMRPDNFEDISAVIALYRPGPMGANAHNDYADRKNGRQKITPIHPDLEDALAEILSDTYGLIVYQEQVMAIAQQLAGYTLGQADLLRRAMGKKKKEILDKEFEPFSAGMSERFSPEAIKTLWEILVPFSDYAFNKAHSAGYGLVSYWTAYLKANYPAEYMAGLLTSCRDDKDKIAIYLGECRRMGIKVLPPDVNESDANFTPRGTDIRFGLGAVRNVGANVVASIARAREEKGRFTDFHDFLSKIDAVACNKRTVESLIKAGAFDSLGHMRKGLLTIHAEAIDAYMHTKRNEAVGQFDLFGGLTDSGADLTSSVTTAIPPGEWEKKELLTFEREMLGLYVSDHPLLGVEHVLASVADTPLSRLADGGIEDGKTVTVAGIFASVTRKVTKQGKVWAMAQLEDLDGSVEVLAFPNTYELVGEYVVPDAIVVVKARVDKREDTPRLIALDLSIPDLGAPAAKAVVVSVATNRCTPGLVEKMRDVLATHPGGTDVHVKLTEGKRTTVMRLGDELRVDATPALMADLKALLGPASVGG